MLCIAPATVSPYNAIRSIYYGPTPYVASVRVLPTEEFTTPATKYVLFPQKRSKSNRWPLPGDGASVPGTTMYSFLWFGPDVCVMRKQVEAEGHEVEYLRHELRGKRCSGKRCGDKA